MENLTQLLRILVSIMCGKVYTNLDTGLTHRILKGGSSSRYTNEINSCLL